jgi:hypothetical protein
MQQSTVLSYANVFVDSLAPGERLVWTGQPRRGIVFRPSDLGTIPFSLMWCGFACFWEASVLGLTGFTKGGGAPLIMKLWGLPIVAIGIYFVAGRFFYDAWRRSRTFYGVTNNRVLILERIMNVKVTSLALLSLPPIVRTMTGPDTGSLAFGVSSPFRQSSRGVNWGNASGCPTFEYVQGVRELEELIHSLQRAQSPRSPH